MKSSCTELNPARKRLARIRCLDECVNCLRENKPMPKSLCYVPKEVKYQITKTTKIPLYAEPEKDSQEVGCLIVFVPSTESAEKHVLITQGEELCTSQGQWARFIKYLKTDSGDADKWVFLYSSEAGVSDNSPLVPLSNEFPLTAHELVHGAHRKTICSWQEVVEYDKSVMLGKPPLIQAAHDEAVSRLRQVPPNWSLDHDEDLGQFLCHHLESDNEHLGGIKNYVDSVKVSSSSEDDEGPENLTDGDTETYWESDGNQGDHCITIRMKPGTIIKQFLVTIDGSDDNYMPYRFIIKGGDTNAMKQINDVLVDQSIYGPADVLVLQDQTEHYPVIEIWIKECKDDGIDTRIHGIKLKSNKERELGLNKDLFTAENLVRFPKLEPYDPETLYRRALMLQRFVWLLDSVLPFIVPTWEFSIGSVTSVELVRQLLPLSKKRTSLVDRFLRESESGQRLSAKKLYINRRTAAEHRADPSLDPLCKNSVFCQVFEGLKPRERTEKPLDYRWSARCEQWWECKFIGEGIIDQGGGFRDSLSDIAEELCPSAHDALLPLPFFIRSPNQSKADSNINRDMYIPNPSHDDFVRYEWIGKLMGACFRGKENLVLSLPQFVWKKLSEERVTWLRDFITVDESEVRMIENMSSMDESDFDAYFNEERTWTTILSDGTQVPLIPNGVDSVVHYPERHEYAEKVKCIRMSESDKQIDAIKRGLLSVIPKAVIDLLTWQEIEKRVCGNPNITIEALKRSTHYEDLEEDDTQVKYMWEALTIFSIEDRSRFLRFVTGRRRLPAPLYICQGKGVDALPESSTCSNTLYLPNYTSSKLAEEKLRYASYNCIAIDTDMSPWDT